MINLSKNGFNYVERFLCETSLSQNSANTCKVTRPSKSYEMFKIFARLRRATMVIKGDTEASTSKKNWSDLFSEEAPTSAVLHKLGGPWQKKWSD